jgi:hypothetical protein
MQLTSQGSSLLHQDCAPRSHGGTQRPMRSKVPSMARIAQPRSPLRALLPNAKRARPLPATSPLLLVLVARDGIDQTQDRSPGHIKYLRSRRNHQMNQKII